MTTVYVLAAITAIVTFVTFGYLAVSPEQSTRHN